MVTACLNKLNWHSPQALSHDGVRDAPTDDSLRKTSQPPQYRLFRSLSVSLCTQGSMPDFEMRCRCSDGDV